MKIVFCMYYKRISNSKLNYGLFILLPSFSGNTGGYLSSACQEEHYLIKWYSVGNQIIELPTGGSALMRKGENILYFAKKEQCLAICRQLRTLFKIYESFVFRRFTREKAISVRRAQKILAGEKLTPSLILEKSLIIILELIYKYNKNLVRFIELLYLEVSARQKESNSTDLVIVQKQAKIQFIHPKDGIIPEKIASGRQGVNQVSISIGGILALYTGYKYRIYRSYESLLSYANDFD